ncbi:MAG: fibronectin type III domain-containing protein, partial [Verrucomicrobiales bacterium]
MNNNSSLLPHPATALLCAVLVIGAGAEKQAAAAPEEASELFSRAPYLQLATSSSVFIAWRTSEEIDASVRFGTDLEALEKSPSEIQIRQTLADDADGKFPLHSAPEGTFQYEVKLTGLEPDTEY